MADQDGSDDSSPLSSQASFYKLDDGRVSSPARPSSSLSGQVYSPTLTSTPTPTPTATSNSPSCNTAAPKIDSLLFNKTDERLRLARERREEREKLNAAKEAQWQAREERARQHYEKHIEERRRKLEEQRMKEEQRRLAVEEKRRQKLEDDKVRHEAVMRRTMERSQLTRPKTNRWSWGGPLHASSSGTPTDADRRSVSTVNLSKHHDPVITKRLSLSSATLLHSPDRGLKTRTTSTPVVNEAPSKTRLIQGMTTHHRNTGSRRLPLTPWESNVVNRLQQPTHSYLARSRSAMSLSGEQTAMPVCPRSVSCQPMGSLSFKTLQSHPLSHSRSHDRSLSSGTASSAPARRRTTGTTQTPQKNRDSVRKSWNSMSIPLGPALTLPLKLRSSSPIKRNTKVTAPTPGRPPQKTTGRPPTPKMLKSPGTEDPGNLRPVKESPEMVRPSTPSKTKEVEDEQVLSPPQQPDHNKMEQMTTTTSDPALKPSAGTMDREEASRILAENRRVVREQREREEEERRQQEEQARLAKEEMARRKAEERAKREEEARRQAEERRLKEEEERKMEEERLQKEREEAESAQKQREEEETRQKEETERLRQEREKHFQKEEAERLERKKRLEEIMKRTRRSDTAENKATPNKNSDGPVAAASLSPSEGTPTLHRNGTGSQPDPNLAASTSTLSPLVQRENGEFEEVLELPLHPRLQEDELQQQEGEEAEERVHVIAFRENGLPKPLGGGVDDIAARQGADVA